MAENDQTGGNRDFIEIIENKYKVQVDELHNKISEIKESHEDAIAKLDEDFISATQDNNDKIAVIENESDLKIASLKEDITEQLSGSKIKISQIKDNFNIEKERRRNQFSLDKEKHNELQESYIAKYNHEIGKITKELNTSVSSYKDKIDEFYSGFDSKVAIYEDKNTALNEDILKKIEEAKNNIDDFKTRMNEDLDVHFNDYSKKVDDINENLADSLKRMDRGAKIFENDINSNISDIKKDMSTLESPLVKTNNEMIMTLQNSIEKIKLNLQSYKDNILAETNPKIKKLSLAFTEAKRAKLKNKIAEFQLKLNAQQSKISTILEIEEKIAKRKIQSIDNRIKALHRLNDYETKNQKKFLVPFVSHEEKIIDISKAGLEANKAAASFVAKSLMHTEQFRLKHVSINNKTLSDINAIYHKLKINEYEKALDATSTLYKINVEVDTLQKKLDCLAPEQKIKINDLRLKLKTFELEKQHEIDLLKHTHEIYKLKQQMDLDLEIQRIKTYGQGSEFDKNIKDLQNLQKKELTILEAERKTRLAKLKYKNRIHEIKRDELIEKERYLRNKEISKLESQIQILNYKKNQELSKHGISSELTTINSELDKKVDLQKMYLDDEISRTNKQIELIKQETDLNIDQIDKQLEITIDRLSVGLRESKGERVRKLNLIDSALDREISIPKNNLNEITIEMESKFNTIFEITSSEEKRIESYIDKTRNEDFENIYREKDRLLLDVDFINTIKNNIRMLYNQKIIAIASSYDGLLNASRYRLSILKANAGIQVREELENTINELETKKNESLIAMDKQVIKSHGLYEKLVMPYMKKLEKTTNDNSKAISSNLESIYGLTRTFYDTLHRDLINEITNLYNPLLELDQKIITNAQEYAKNAKDIIESEFNSSNKPIRDEIEENKRQCENIKKERISDMEERIRALSEAIETSTRDTRENISLEQQSTQSQLSILQKSHNLSEDDLGILIEGLQNKQKNFEYEIENRYSDFLRQSSEYEIEANSQYESDIKVNDHTKGTANAKYMESKVEAENILIKTITNERSNIDKVSRDVQEAIDIKVFKMNNMIEKIEREILIKKPELQQDVDTAELSTEQIRAELIDKINQFKKQIHIVRDAMDTSYEISINDLYEKFEPAFDDYFIGIQTIENALKTYVETTSEEVEDITTKYQDNLTRIDLEASKQVKQQLDKIYRELANL